MIVTANKSDFNNEDNIKAMAVYTINSKNMLSIQIPNIATGGNVIARPLLNIVNMLADANPQKAPPTHKAIIPLNSVKMKDRESIAKNLPKNISFLDIGRIAKYRIVPSLVSPAIE